MRGLTWWEVHARKSRGSMRSFLLFSGDLGYGRHPMCYPMG